MNLTMQAFLSMGNISKKSAQNYLNNIETKALINIESNITQLEFDFDKEKVTISYFIIDPNYPDTLLTFAEFQKVLKMYIKEN